MGVGKLVYVEIVGVRPYPNVNFGYKTQLKDILHTCVYCGKHMKRLTTEHILPHSKGGADNVKNYLAVCSNCNSKRGNMDFSKWFKMHPEIELYIKRMLETLKGKKVDGVDYTKEVKKTLNEQVGKKIFFKGGKLDVWA